MQSTIKKYYYLAKPGIVRGNAITASAGYFFGAGRSANITILLWLFLGSSLVIASACVLNNILDIEIDKKMKRTQKRALVTGAISIPQALGFAIAMIIAGLSILAFKTTMAAAIAASLGWFFYFVVYTFSKRATVHSTLIGAISGAIPPVIGYLAATGSLDMVAVVLFIILAVWQMPHFYAIAIYRQQEYKAAGIPLWSVIYGKDSTRRQMIGYGALFIPAVLSLGLVTNISFSYLLVMLVVAAIWLKMMLEYSGTKNVDSWARGVFKFSLLVLLTFSLMISLDALLP